MVLNPVQLPIPFSRMRPVEIRCHTLSAVNWQVLTDWPPPDTLAIYRASVAELGPLIPWFTALLTAEEKTRAGRYHQAHDQRRFTIARGIVRALLSHYTQQPPATIALVPGPNKKPVVSGFPALHYNVSHAGNWVLIAVGPEPAGVDVEWVNPDFAYEPLLPGSFSRAERQYITESPASRCCFYQLWTRKEALTKATAKGIDDDFNQIPSLDGVHSVADDLMPTTRNWTVSSFAVADDYAAAVAYPAATTGQSASFYTVNEQLLNP